jgi:hypothetical protein
MKKEAPPEITIQLQKDPNSLTERIFWRAVYNDGTVLNQHEDGKENRYQDIDRNKLVRFDLCIDNRTFLSIRIKTPRQQLIFRRRTEMQMGQTYRTVVIIAGWHMQLHGENVQSIHAIYPNGYIESAGAWDEKDPWLYAVELLDQEK